MSDLATKVITYEIPVDDFIAPGPTSPTQYDASQRVNRESFMSLIIDSFAKSRGEPACQYFFLEWFEVHNGLKYRNTLINYMEAGGWDFFSAEEQEMFVAAYRSVSEHTSSYDWHGEGRKKLPTKVDRELNKLIKSESDIIGQWNRLFEDGLDEWELEDLSLQDLTGIIDTYIQREKKRLSAVEAKLNGTKH